MKRTSLALADSFGRSALRQPVFIALLLLPPMMGLLLRPLPAGLALVAPNFDPKPWMPLFLSVVAGFPPYFFGLLAGLMLLDERDRQLLPALRVTPISDRHLLAAKVMPAALLAMIASPLTLSLSGEAVEIPVGALLASGLVAAPSTVFYALTVTTLARNKVQGITIGKILGTVLPAPVGFVLLTRPWNLALLLFPSSWMGAAFNDPANWTAWVIGGTLYAGALGVISWNGAVRRYFTPE